MASLRTSPECLKWKEQEGKVLIVGGEIREAASQVQVLWTTYMYMTVPSSVGHIHIHDCARLCGPHTCTRLCQALWAMARTLEFYYEIRSQYRVLGKGEMGLIKV